MSLVTNLDNIFKKSVIGSVRKTQNDSFGMALASPNGDFFVVCGGIGERKGEASASALATDSIVSFLKKEKYPNPTTALKGALQFANMQILGFASTIQECNSMCTTVCIVLMQENEVWIAYSGDSRIYLYLDKEKELHRLTKDHTYVQTLIDKGLITDEESEHHPDKERVLKALGLTPDLEPSVNGPIHPENDDIFLICTDGLNDMIPDSRIEKILRMNASVEGKGNMLIAAAMEGETIQPGGQDNCTLELIQIDNSPWQNAKFNSINPLDDVSNSSTNSISRWLRTFFGESKNDSAFKQCPNEHYYQGEVCPYCKKGMPEWLNGIEWRSPSELNKHVFF